MMKATWITLLFLGLLAGGKFLVQTPKLITPSQNPKAATTLVIPEAKRLQTIVSYGKLPLRFESNQGQTDTQVKFLCRSRGLFLTATEAVLSVAKPGREAKPMLGRATFNHSAQADTITNVLRVSFVGANPAPEISGLEELPGRSNYFSGSDPSKWHTAIPNYAAVRYKDVYPGIDLMYYGNNEDLEFDWVLTPGANPKLIKLAIRGAENISLDAQEGLLIESGGNEMRLRKPTIYQVEEEQQKPGNVQNDRGYARMNGANRKHFIEGNYVVKDTHMVTFDVAAYDLDRPLIIDPVLSYSTFLGGNGEDHGNAIAIDANGNAYIAGWTASSNFPTKNPLQASFHGIQDAFVAKFNPSTSGAVSLLYSTYLGSSNGNAFALGIAVDSAGNAYVTGGTGSTNFPTTPGAFQTAAASPGDAFVSKLDPTGSVLAYSTYLGGSGNNDQGLSIAVDASGAAYVAGFTDSLNFPTKNAFQSSMGGGLLDAFLTKLNPTGSALLYSTYLGGSGDEQGASIAIDSSGNAYVTGSTGSTNFPTTVGAFQTSVSGVGDAFVAKLNPALSGIPSVIYSTYLGGSASDEGSGIAVDSAGNAYVTGSTFSTNFPTTSGAFQRALNGTQDAFISKLNTAGSALVFSTLLGGSSFDQGNAVSVDSSDNVYVTGQTDSIDFPVTPDAFRSSSQGGNDAFVTKLNSSGSSLTSSTYLGGTNLNIATGIAVDATGSAYVTGFTRSADFPTTNPFQAVCASCLPGSAATDAFLSKISFSGADFSMSVSPGSATIFAGQSTNFTLSMTPLNGFNQMVNLTCTGEPPAASCSISPASVALNGTTATTATVTITTMRHTMLFPWLLRVRLPGSFKEVESIRMLLLVSAVLVAWSAVRKRRFCIATTTAAVLALFSCVACVGSGGGGGGSTGTPTGIYSILVTGTSGSVVHGTTVTLTVE
jgi:hypothetical protein